MNVSVKRSADKPENPYSDFRVQVSFCAFREGIEKINSIFAVCRVNWADW